MSQEANPLPEIDAWEESLRQRYPQGKKAEDFRNYAGGESPGVREFYRLNHRYQTVDFVLAKKREYLPLRRKQMSAWEAMEYLNTLVDDSDPDTALSQIEHLLQVAEAIRRDGKPRWFILTGLLHDLGKILCLFGEPQWAVVGDTFPVGCAFSEKVVLPEYFTENPDSKVELYASRLGIYSEGCGLDQVHLAWGHDEYLYQVLRDYLPEEARYMIRFHSFYAAHRDGAYDFLMNGHDREMFAWVRAFNPYDLYTKSSKRPDVKALRPYYEDLIREFLPPVLQW